MKYILLLGQEEQVVHWMPPIFLNPPLQGVNCNVSAPATLDEYRMYIEKDGALDRRFQKVMVEQPSVEETIEILTQY